MCARKSTVFVEQLKEGLAGNTVTVSEYGAANAVRAETASRILPLYPTYSTCWGGKNRSQKICPAGTSNCAATSSQDFTNGAGPHKYRSGLT